MDVTIGSCSDESVKPDLGKEEVDQQAGNGEIDIMDVAAGMAYALEKSDQIIDRQERWKLLRRSFEHFMSSTLEATEQIVRRRQRERLITSTLDGADKDYHAKLKKLTFNDAKAVDENNVLYVKVFFISNQSFNTLSFAKFQSNFKIGDLRFPSIGQAYQYIRLMNVGKWEVAQRVRMCSLGMDAFRMAEFEFPDSDPEWAKIRKPVMLMVLKRCAKRNSKMLKTLRKNGARAKYLAQCVENPIWGCSVEGMPDGDRWQNLYGDCLSEAADFLIARQPLAKIPNSDAILACCKWQVEHKPPGNKVLVVADRQLKTISAKLDDTQIIHASETAVTVSADPSPDQGTVGVESLLDQCSNLSEIDCIILAVTSDDILLKPSLIDQAYTQLLSWLVQQTNALIYIVGGYPRKREGAWNPAVHIGNIALRSVCQKFPKRTFLIDIPALIQQCGGYPTESLYIAQFLDPKTSCSELNYYGQIRLASLITSVVPVCSLLYFDEVNIVPLSKSMADHLVSIGLSYYDETKRRQLKKKELNKKRYKAESAKKEAQQGGGKWKKGSVSSGGGLVNVPAMDSGRIPTLITNRFLGFR